MNEYIKHLISAQGLSKEASFKLFSELSQSSVEQQAAILALFACKKETTEELLGARELMLNHAIPIPSQYDVVDIVGTGGDGIGTFNISTATSIIVSSAGVSVAKHGGKASTSKSGSADVLEQLGIPLESAPSKIIDNIINYNYAYLWAPLFNPVLKIFSELRRKLNFPSIFNTLCPLINPMHPKRQVIGVYREDLILTVAEVLRKTGSVHAMVVHSTDGLDELSISAATHIAEVKNNAIKEYSITPEEFGLPRYKISEVLGGTPLENANIIRGVIAGEILGAKRDILLLNAAAGLVVADIANNLREGVEIAKEILASGKSLALFNKLTEGA